MKGGNAGVKRVFAKGLPPGMCSTCYLPYQHGSHSLVKQRPDVVGRGWSLESNKLSLNFGSSIVTMHKLFYLSEP